MDKCSNCGKISPLTKCSITDSMGTRYRDLCDECIFIFAKEAKIKSADGANLEVLEHKCKSILISSCNTIEGCDIVKYHDMIFEQKMTGLGIKTALKSVWDSFANLTGDEQYAIAERITQLKNEALKQLKIKALNLGANAVIGVSFETTIPSSSAIIISVSGTAVTYVPAESKNAGADGGQRRRA